MAKRNGKAGVAANRNDVVVSARVRRKMEAVFEAPPASEAEALIEDLRQARRTHKGINERIAAMCELATETVYAWKDRHQFTDLERRAIVLYTGGRNWLAYWHRISNSGPHGLCAGELPACAAEVNELVARMMRQVTEDLGPRDDTPGVLDRAERGQLAEQARTAIARLTKFVGALESGEM